MYISIITNYHYISGSRPAITPQTQTCLWGPDAGMTRGCGISHYSRARGPRKHEYVCGVDKAGIGLGLLLVI